MRVRSAFVVMSLLLMSGCRGCFCTNAAKAVSEAPPPDVIEQKTREALEKNPTILWTLCGVRVVTLENMKLTVVKAGHTSNVRVEGKAVFSDAGADAGVEVEDDDEDASVRVLAMDRNKALLCAGVVALAVVADLDREGHGHGWTTTGIEVDSVETAGVHFDKAKYAAKHHHHHHHH